MIFSLVAMTGLEKCCITSAYLQWLCHSGERPVARGPLVIENVNTSSNDHNSKWKLNKANRELYHSLGEESIKPERFENSLDPIADFTSLLDISNKSIPKTSTNPKKSRPWYNDECKDAIKQRKQALSKFCRYPTKENLNKFKNFRAKARRTIKASNHKSWESYVPNLNHKTPIKKVWDMIRKISGKSKSPSFTHLNTKRRPRWLGWMRRPTGDQEVAGSTPAKVGNILSWRLIMKYFLRSFSPFR